MRLAALLALSLALASSGCSSGAGDVVAPADAGEVSLDGGSGSSDGGSGSSDGGSGNGDAGLGCEAGGCDDGNPCTDDVCELGVCRNAPNESTCDDGLFCNGADFCQESSCSAHAGDPCSGGADCADTCDEAADGCFSPVDTACADEGDSCTADTCNGAGVCEHTGSCCGNGSVDEGETCGEPQLPACGQAQRCGGCVCEDVYLLESGSVFACASRAGQLKCWGRNESGQLGIGSIYTQGISESGMGDALPEVDLGTGRVATALAAGRDFACALLDTEQLVCWGGNTFGQLGVPTGGASIGDAPGEMGDALVAVSLGAQRKAKKVAAGDLHACVLLDTDQVKCWGRNSDGQLGLGDKVSRGGRADEVAALVPLDLGTGRTVVQLAAGSEHNCALLDDGTVKCWGRNIFGLLGQGDEADRGDEPGELGDALAPVALGTGRKAKQIASGPYFNCAILDDDTVKCWGDNSEAQLGQGDKEHRGDAAGEMGDALQVVALGTGRKAVQLALANGHACAILDDRTVKCWGDGEFGQVGQGNRADLGDAAGEMGDALPVVALGTGRTATALSPGHLFTCALLDDRSIKCWGYAAYGVLGFGIAGSIGDDPGEMGDALREVDLGGL